MSKTAQQLGPFTATAGPVVVVDDDPTVRRLLKEWLTNRGQRVIEMETGEELAEHALSSLGAICLDLNLPNISGLDILRRVAADDPDLPVIVISGRDEVETAVEAMRAGAYDYLVKPIERDRFEVVMHNALERRGLTNALARLQVANADLEGSKAIIGRSAPMVELARQVRRVVDSDVVVALTGESGTGKELVARALHEGGRHAAGPFVAINCAAIPESLHESELFGHERGSFTGAVGSHEGRFEQARAGTLFLDEVGDMSPLTQASLLRALQERTIRRVGGTEEIPVDVRVVCATHKDLLEEVRGGRFREDLYFRLVVYPIRVPPLRERKVDIPMLVNHFLRKYEVDVGRRINRVAPSVLESLGRFEWPGNVRQLENVVHRAMLACDGAELASEHLPSELRTLTGMGSAPVDLDDDALGDDEVIPVRELERRAIKKALRVSGGSVEKAAKLLGMGRATLYRRLAHYDRNGNEL